MTPDTAAWRTLADAALQPLMPHMDFRQQVALDRARKDAARALCDASDEVERLRKAVWASEEIDRRAGMLAGVAAERDASRTAHAALVAELRALRARSGYVLAADVLALLDRHALTTGDVA